MKQSNLYLRLCLIAVSCSLPMVSKAQQPAGAVPATSASIVPQLINYSGRLIDLNGKPLERVAGVTFSLYQDSQGGAPLWVETQNVQPDANGHYTVTLGSTTAQGLPQDMFTGAEARWMGVRIDGQEEQPRVLLVAVPYALKAGDAQTLGGLPASAFVLAAPPATISVASVEGAPATTTTAPAQSSESSDVTTTGGTVGTIAAFSTATNVQSSILSQTGTTAINVAGKLNLPATGIATSSAGFNSRPQNFVASAYNSGSAAAVAQSFEWQAQPVGNDTALPSASLNLLFGSGTTAPAQTGFSIASTGLITFAIGQTFPGAGNGTVTSVGSGAGLAGGPITSSGALSIATGGVTNAMLQHPSLTVTAGTGLSGGGSVALGGTDTLSINSTVIPQLAANNTFTGSNTFSSTASNGLSATSSVAGDSGVFASDSATTGSSNGLFASGSSPTGTGIAAVNYATSGTALAVYGQSNSSAGTGVFGSGDAVGVSGLAGGASGIGALGVGNTGSVEKSELGTIVAGMWGDTGAAGMYGVMATADDGRAVAGFNSAEIFPTAYFENDFNDGTALVLLTGAQDSEQYCAINESGDLSCTGTITQNVPATDGKSKVALNALSSPESWFEDAGSGQLQDGEAVVEIEPGFAATVNTGVDYHVFLTPGGDCKGLYIAQKSATSFTVRELGGGTSSIAFDYRIMAKRKGYERVRLLDTTKTFASSRRPKRATIRNEGMNP